MKLYSYIIKSDSGFAPNPFWGYCTLACCKPALRRAAKKGDWVVGLSPKRHGNKIIFAMEVTESPITFAQYSTDKRFNNKIPDYSKSDVIFKRGDNIYMPLPNGKFKQLKSVHSNGDKENKKYKSRDLEGNFVLISNNFYYFGSNAIELPKNLKDLIVARGHKSKFSDETILNFIKFISKRKKGIKTLPSLLFDSCRFI